MGTRAVGTLFLERLFDKNTVLFLGYSLDDVLVRYLLKAQTTMSELYTLTTNPHESRWRELRVHPVGIDSYRQLPAILSVWADYAASGIWVRPAASVRSWPLVHPSDKMPMMPTSARYFRIPQGWAVHRPRSGLKVAYMGRGHPASRPAVHAVRRRHRSPA